MDSKTAARKDSLEKSMRRCRTVGAINAGFAGLLGSQTVVLALDGDALMAVCLGAVAVLNAGLAVANGRNAVKSKRMIDEMVKEHVAKDALVAQLQNQKTK